MWTLLTNLCSVGLYVSLVGFWVIGIVGLFTDTPVEGALVLAGSILATSIFTTLVISATGLQQREADSRQHARAPTEDDLSRLEQALGIVLSDAYRRLMLDFPVRSRRGADWGPIWNDVDHVIAKNAKRRTDAESWPAHHVLIGGYGRSLQHVLDASENGQRVIVLEPPGWPAEGPAAPRCTTLDEIAAEMRAEETSDGHDPDAVQRTPTESPGERARSFLWIVLWVFGLPLAIGSCNALLGSL